MKIRPESEALGRRGEEMFRLFLKEGVDDGRIAYFCRPEWIVVPVEGEPFYVEVKAQAMFEAPPFDGHGLPVWQADRYLDLFSRLGLRTMLVVYDFTAAMQYWGWIDELHRTHFDTPGTRAGPRRIYPITSFKARPLRDRADAA
jgi:hypothetical protein